MARDTGSRSDELVENVVAEFFDELTFTRQTLDRRYDDLESGRVRLDLEAIWEYISEDNPDAARRRERLKP